jgi:uracil-DNA glycosylase family 4
MIGDYVPGYGSPSAKLIVCGEAPGKVEEEEGRPFVGPTGQEVRSMLRNAGVIPEACYFTNVFKYRPPGNNLNRANETGHTIEEGLEDFRNEINSIPANAILSLGNLALENTAGVSGIHQWRGSILQSLFEKKKVVGSIHPANLFERGEERKQLPYSAKMYMQLDFNRAVEESLTSELELPHRNLNYARRYIDLYDFLKRNEKHDKAALDIESIAGIPACVSIAFTRHSSLSIPLINLSHLDSYFDIQAYEMAEIWRLLDKFFRDKRIRFIGQNFKFDQQKLEGIGFKLHALYADTYLLMRLLNPEFPGSLEFISSIYTREPFYKNEWQEFERGKRSVKQWLIYNARDSAVTMESFEELIKEAEEIGAVDFFFNNVMPLHNIYMEMEEVGFRVDYEARDELYSKYVDLQLKEEDELFKLTGYPFNCNSSKKVMYYVYEVMKCPKRFKNGKLSSEEDILVSLMANAVKNERKKQILSRIINIRRLRNAQSKIKSQTDYDGRMRSGFRIAGTEAGRTSTNVLKKPVRQHKMGMAFHSITKHGELGGDIRRMFISDYPMEVK